MLLVYRCCVIHGCVKKIIAQHFQLNVEAQNDGFLENDSKTPNKSLSLIQCVN